MDYYRDTVTEKSWQTLQDLSRSYRFVLIGGWAVWLYTKRLKSKDIDIVIEYDQLEQLRQMYDFSKNDRLKKYEARQGEVHIDVYVPFWSELGVPAEVMLEKYQRYGGFRVPIPEILLVTKLVAYLARVGSAKGQKDLIDIFSLLMLEQFDWDTFHEMIPGNKQSLRVELKSLIKSSVDIPELGMNRHHFARLKKSWLEKI